MNCGQGWGRVRVRVRGTRGTMGTTGTTGTRSTRGTTAAKGRGTSKRVQQV